MSPQLLPGSETVRSFNQTTVRFSQPNKMIGVGEEAHLRVRVRIRVIATAAEPVKHGTFFSCHMTALSQPLSI